MKYFNWLFLIFLSGEILFAGSSTTEWASDCFRISGVTGGLVVHVGCIDGSVTAGLLRNDRYLVHGLDRDSTHVTKAREVVTGMDCYGRVAVDIYDGLHLPYMDNLVNLIVLTDPECQVTCEEIQRVLSPRGVALIDRSLAPRYTGFGFESGGGWRVYHKPVPKEIDEWSHYLYGPDNNAVSKDKIIAPPRRMQWQCGPLWSRSHETDMSMSGAVSVGGRMIYFIEEGPIGVHETPEKTRRLPDKVSLVCRDAFNGVMLWKRPVPHWGSSAWDEHRWWGIRDQLWSSPQTLPRRLVAIGDRVFVTLGFRAPLSELDALTGESTREFKEVGHVEEILAVEDRLVLRVGEDSSTSRNPSHGELVVVDRISGAIVWRKPVGPVTELSLACAQGRICFLNGEAVTAMDLETGRMLWQVPIPLAKLHLPSLVMYQDIVIVATGGNKAKAYGLAASDGRLLWQQDAGRGSFRGNADVFVTNDLLWVGTLSTRGFEPRTGKLVKQVQIPELFTKGHHSRCYRARATEDYLLWSKRGIELLDLDGEGHSRNDWVRGTCRYGIMPANGLLYAPPTPCFCYPGVKLNGFVALAPEGSESVSSGQRAESGKQGTEHRLEHGPAFSQRGISHSPPATSHDWPTYRHDNQRSGASRSSVPAMLQPQWSTKVGTNLTPPVLAAGRLFLTDKDSHSVHCLDASSGSVLWRVIVGGAVDSPPTLHGDRLLFGCTDGWVYCLLASDGTMVWRFRAAPRDQRIVSYGQIQSSWPVHGSVLVKNNTAYVTAGRSSFLDGGLYLFGLDVTTGEIRCRQHLDGPWDDPRQASPHGAHWMDGARTDILVCSGNRLYMMQNVFDLDLEPLEAPVVARHGAREMDLHLSATGGFLDDTGFDRLFWMYARRWPGLYFGYNAPKVGQLIVFDRETTYALHMFDELFSRSPYHAPGRDGYLVIADDNGNEPYLDPAAARRERQPGYSRQHPSKWQVKVPIRTRAMVLANKTLFLAGPPDQIDPDDPLATFEGRAGALLRAVSATDGDTLSEIELGAPPVFDGMIAAMDCLYLSTVNGTVLCLGPVQSDGAR